MRKTLLSALVAVLVASCSKQKQVQEPPDGVDPPIERKEGTQEVTVHCDFDQAWVALVPTAVYRQDEYLMQALIGFAEEPGFWATTEYANLAPFAAKRCQPTATFDVAKGSYKLVVGAQGRFDQVKMEYGINGLMRDVTVSGSAEWKFAASDLNMSWSCISCPHVYVWDGHEFHFRGEVLRDVIGAGAERTDRRAIGKVRVTRGAVRLKLAEEEDEVSHVDALMLEIDGKTYRPAHTSLSDHDDDRATLRRGDELVLTYQVDLADGDYEANVAATGYYVPLAPLR